MARAPFPQTKHRPVARTFEHPMARSQFASTGPFSCPGVHFGTPRPRRHRHVRRDQPFRSRGRVAAAAPPPQRAWRFRRGPSSCGAGTGNAGPTRGNNRTCTVAIVRKAPPVRTVFTYSYTPVSSGLSWDRACATHRFCRSPKEKSRARLAAVAARRSVASVTCFRVQPRRRRQMVPTRARPSSASADGSGMGCWVRTTLSMY